MIPTIDAFLKQLKSAPESIRFEDSLTLIDAHFDFRPVAFQNGDLSNRANENNGSCKLLAFAQQHALSQQLTLHLFGDYYRGEVLGDPDGTSHQNIRNFMLNGWKGVVFRDNPLTLKTN